MKRSDLIKELSGKTGVKEQDIRKIFTAYSDIVIQNLRQSKSIMLPGLGSFGVLHHAESAARNPRTNEVTVLEEYDYPRFTPWKRFRDALKKS